MRPIRLTNAHQSITFSRRMPAARAAQAAIGGLLIARMGWLSVAQNAKYQLLSESNRVQLIPVPPRRGWLIDRNGKPIAINRSSFRVDIIPQQLVDPPKGRRRSLQDPRASAGRGRPDSEGAATSRGFQPVSVADNVPYEKYAAITVRMPEPAGDRGIARFTRYYPAAQPWPAGRLCGRRQCQGI